MITHATFGAGCFWQVEERFRVVKRINYTKVGFMGGKLKDPTYEEVCEGNTGHVEVVEVTFDTDRVKYEDLLEVFWRIHDPTLVDRQGENVGSQYKSIIYYYSEDQKKKAFLSKDKLMKSKKYKDEIVTEIRKATEFFPASEMHQKYLMKKQQKLILDEKSVSAEPMLNVKSDSTVEKNI